MRIHQGCGLGTNGLFFFAELGQELVFAASPQGQCFHEAALTLSHEGRPQRLSGEESGQTAPDWEENEINGKEFSLMGCAVLGVALCLLPRQIAAGEGCSTRCLW